MPHLRSLAVTKSALHPVLALATPLALALALAVPTPAYAHGGHGGPEGGHHGDAAGLAGDASATAAGDCAGHARKAKPCCDKGGAKPKHDAEGCSSCGTAGLVGNAPGKGKLTLAVAVNGARLAAERSSAFQVDADGAQAPDGIEVGSRLGLGLHLEAQPPEGGMRVEGNVGVELWQGVFSGRPTLAGDRRPGDLWNAAQLTEAWAGVSLGERDAERVGLRAGLQLSQWGLGLLANDGRSYASDGPGSWFSLPYVGDRVLRTAVWARPWAGTTSNLRGLVLSLAVDRVASDDITLPIANPDFMAFHRDEVAWQGIFAARMHLSERDWLGLYYVYRDQRTTGPVGVGGKSLAVHSADLACDVGLIDRADLTLRFAAESVGIFGTTTLAPTPDFPTHDVLQGAAVGRFDLRMGSLLALLDLGWFSGDASADDATIGNFKADPNFQQGIVLFRRIVGWQTARMRRTASNPDVVGYPNEDIERLSSAGSLTSAITVFPRIGARLGRAEIYGGLLLALTPTPIADPYHSRVHGGGAARNVYSQAPDGPLLGSELDAGVRMRFDVVPGGAQLVAGVEYGIALPGGALAGLDSNVHGGRVVLTLTGARPEASR